MRPPSARARVTLALLLCASAASPFSLGVPSESLNPATGALDVDYAGYLSKHDVIFNHPITNPQFGATVGNGRVGAMVWGSDGLDLQISGVDASEETAFSAGVIHLRTADGGHGSHSPFQERLSLFNGTLVIKYDDTRTITVMGSPNSEVLGIHVADGNPGVGATTLDLGIWDVQGTTGGDVRSMNSWRTVATYADAGGVGLSRGQRDPDHFGYTLAATVQGAGFTTSTVDPNTVRMIIAPSSSYTIWIACASRLNAPDHNSPARAIAMLNEVSSKAYGTTLEAYQAWWHRFWRRSFVQYSSGLRDDDYLENLYYLYTYVIAAGSYGNYPFHFINGDFGANGDANSAKWSVAYWYWNQRDVYNSFFASNHADALKAFDRLYTRNLSALTAHTRERFGISGVWVPETMGWDGNARHTEESDWTRDIFSTGAEVAANLYSEYQYTNDVEYLRTTAYPFMKGVALFYAGKLTRDPDTGRYFMARSNAHETYWGVKDAITDLAAVRSLFPAVIKTSQVLGVDSDLQRQWQIVLDNLAPYPLVDDRTSYAAHDPPPSLNRNWQNITSELVWPYGVTGIGASDYALALNGWLKRPYPYGNIWSTDAIQAARLGLGDEASNGMKFMIRTFQTCPNGLTLDANGRFEYLGSHLSAMNESLLQSYDDKIRVFPALPRIPGFIARFTLLAKGGFMVTSEAENNDIKYVSVNSLYGNAATLENPWPGERTRIRRAADGADLIVTTQRELSFRTAPHTVYIIERMSRPLGNFRHLVLTGVANNEAKRMPASKAVLGAD